MDIISGIYKFENKINHHVYIGQSKNILQRYQDHLSRYKHPRTTNSEYNSIFHQALRKYGIENFTFEIIEECPPVLEILNQREIYWIAYYDSYNNGYNATLGGQTGVVTSYKLTDDIITMIKNDLINSNLTYNELHKKYNISTGRISEINTGKIYQDSSLNYPLRQSKKNTQQICPYCGRRKDKTAECCIECYKTRYVKQYPITREQLKMLIRSQPFTKIGAQFNVTDNTIRKWCDGYRLPRTKKEINKYTDKEWEII